MRTGMPEPEKVDDHINGHHSVVANIILNYKLSVIAEVGVYKGVMMRKVLRSGANLLIREYFAIDPWERNEFHWKGASQEKWDGMYRNVCKYMPWFRQLKILRMHSVDAANLFWDGYFDLVYIDGDHGYESVTQDILAWLPKIKRPGIMAGHDYWDEMYDGYEVKRAVDNGFGEKSFFK